jgi:hypothetical protein
MDITKNPLKGMSKPEKYAVFGGTALIGGFLIYDHHKNTGSWNPWSSSSTASNSTATTIDPVTGLAYSQDDVIDPITGETYLAEATQYGSVSAAEASVSAYGASTASGSGIGVNPASPAPAGSVNTVVGGSVYTSNSAWAQAATAGLTDVGYSATDVATALGDYLTGVPVTAAQASLINTAIAEYGPVPDGPLQVILAPATTPSPVTTGSTGTTASKLPAPTGLKASDVSATGYSLSWDSVTGAKGYTVETYNSKGVSVDQFDVTGTSTKEYGEGGKGLPAGTYHSNVWANGGAVAPPHATVYATIK